VSAWLQHKIWLVGAFVWGVAEATLFFIVPDVLLSYMGLRFGRHTAITASVVAALGAALGGAFMYLWSLSDPPGAYAAVLATPAVSAQMADAAWAAMARDGWFAATFLGPLTSTPFKVYAVLAPHADAPLVRFMVAAVIARLPRFLLMSVGSAYLARWLEPRFGMRRLSLMLGLAWLAFYVVFFAVMPN
jgi:membrane protein YqaA with SNARE-associated domain